MKKPIRTKSCNVATYPKHKYKRGDKVTIKSSPYAGINPGDEGIVNGLLRPGYAIAFVKHWPETFINEKPPLGKRVMFFEHGEIE